MNKNEEMFLFVGFGVVPSPITRAVCLNMFYFGVSGARLIFLSNVINLYLQEA